MKKRNKIYVVAMFAAALTALVGVPGAASAQQAGNAPTTTVPAANSSQAKPAAENNKLRARDLMTPAERETYRASMHSATDDQARARVRTEWKTRLQQRATERGGVLVDGRGNPPRVANGNGQEEAPPPQATRPPPRAL
jgi:hypothetical protein